MSSASELLVDYYRTLEPYALAFPALALAYLAVDAVWGAPNVVPLAILAVLLPFLAGNMLVTKVNGR